MKMSLISWKHRICQASKLSIYFILVDAYPQSNELSDNDFLLAKLKHSICLIQYKYLSVLIETLSRLFFIKNWLMLELFNFYGILY